MNIGTTTRNDSLRHVRMRISELERDFTPQEMLVHAEHAEANGCHLMAEVLRVSPTVTFLRRQQRLEPFIRRVLSNGAMFYAGGFTRANRSLLVGFCGKADRLMLPLPMFLQHLPAANWDVLVLKDKLRTHYRQGVSGFADGFPGLVRRTVFLSKGYTRCVALGTSMGGFPAARFALLAGAERGISIGGRPPNDVLRLQSNSAPGIAFDPLCACLTRRECGLLFTYAAGSANDSEPAKAFASLTGGRHLAVDGQIDHGFLHALHLKGGLQDFLDAILNNPVQSLGQSGQRHG